MENPAKTQQPIHDLLRRRWSPRAFAAQAVEPQTLVSLLEAARWAASCYNEQPWSFLVATKDQPQEYARLLGCLVEANQGWAKQAPVLMISVACQRFRRNNKPNRVALHDVGLAAAQFTLEAMARGLFVHMMAGIESDKIRQTYHLPDDCDPVAGIALGYPGDPNGLPPELRQRELEPRERRPLREFVFTGDWNKAAGFVS